MSETRSDWAPEGTQSDAFETGPSGRARSARPRLVGRLVATPALALGAAAITFGAAAPPANCPDVTVADVEAAAGRTVDWIVDNQQADGSYLYEYDRVTGRIELFGSGDTEGELASPTTSNGTTGRETAQRSSASPGGSYNIVRHAGVMVALYQAAGRGYEGALAAGDRGLEWALEHAVERHGWLGIATEPYIQAGTNALLTAALVERRQATGDTQYDELLAKLGTFLVGQVEPSGAVLGYYDLEPDQPRPDRYSIYYTGEAWWALARLHREFPGDGWDVAADAVGNYLATERDRAENLWPPLADHWSGYGLGETAAFPDRPVGTPLTDAELAFVRRQGGVLGQRVRGISERFGPWGELVRGTFSPRGGGYGVFGEGLGGLWRAAQLDERLEDVRGPLAERQVCIVGLAIDAQEDATEAAAYSAPGYVSGAWFQNEVTRMDDQQHALSALFATIPILDSPGDVVGTNPVAWLWLIAVIGVLNPVRAALGLRRSGAGLRQVAAGGVGGAAALFGIGALSGALLDALDVSQPAIRLAAAGLCAFSAIVDLFLPERAPDVAPAGWLGALTPVAVPFVIRPALVVAGWSVVADHGLPLYGLALLIAVALVVAVSKVPFPAGTGPWLARLVSTLAVAAAVLLVVHAVFDV